VFFTMGLVLHHFVQHVRVEGAMGKDPEILVERRVRKTLIIRKSVHV
jgi:hypothetical protein